MYNDFSGIMMVSDIDGTFLGKSSRLLERNVEAVKRFTAGGGLFTFATGRMILNIRTVIPNVAELVNAPVLMSNGTCIYDYFEDKIINESEMDHDAAFKIVKYVSKNYPNVTLRLSRDRNFYAERNEGYVAKDFSILKPGDYVIAPVEEWPKTHWLKFVLRGAPEDIDKVKADLDVMFGDCLELNKSHPTFLECQRKGCTKASGISYLKKYYRGKYGKDPVLLVCGDYENDYDMLLNADIPICPANALERIKNICDYCLCDHNDGLIADVVEKIESGEIKKVKKALDKPRSV